MFNKHNDFQSHIIAYEQEEEWGKSLSLFDTLLSSRSDSTSLMHGFSAVTAMHMAGYSNLPLFASRNIPSIGGETKSEALWRSRALDLADADAESHAKDEAKGFNGHLLDSLRALEKMVQQKGELDEVAISIESARHVALQELAEHELQSTKRSQPALVRLQCCQDVTDVANVLVKHSGRQDQINRIIARWEKRYKSMQNRFALQEPSIALHGVLLEIVQSDCVQKQLNITAKYALKQGNISYARCAMLKLQHRLCGTDRMRNPDSWWLTQAKVLWADKRKDHAVTMMSDLEAHLRDVKDDGKSRSLLAKVLKVNAEWLTVSRTERWADIRMKMEEGLGLRKENGLSCTNALFKLAAFLDGLYCQDEETLEEVEEKQGRLSDEIKNLKKTYESVKKKVLSVGEQTDRKFLHQKLLRYEEELRNLEEHQNHRKTFMLGAMDNYLAHLQTRGTQKRAVFRVLQIWFENSTFEEVNDALCKKLKEMSSIHHNFAILVPQIVSRLDSDSNSNSSFQRALKLFLSRLLEADPDDTLFPLFFAKNEARGRPATGGIAGVVYTVNQHRVDAVTQLLQSMPTEGLDLKTPEGKMERDKRDKLVKQTEMLIEAYIELADFDIPKTDGRTIDKTGPVRNKMQRIKWGDDDSLVRVPTSQSGSKVASFLRTWDYPGGITRPKKITMWHASVGTSTSERTRSFRCILSRGFLNSSTASLCRGSSATRSPTNRAFGTGFAWGAPGKRKRMWKYGSGSLIRRGKPVCSASGKS